MSDQPSNIVPFGKYKGRSVEEVLADDPAYLQWLASQDWFRTKFTILHQVIINRGAEPEETPEHNALQVKFLDDDFCLRLLAYLDPQYADKAITALRAGHQHNLNGSDVLMVGNYVGTGATREQFVKTFATASKRVVFVREVEGDAI